MMEDSGASHHGHATGLFANVIQTIVKSRVQNIIWSTKNILIILKF